MRRLCVTLFLLVLAFDAIVCPPVTPKKKEEPPKEEKDDDEDAGDDAFGLEYERYLKEVVSVLESDDSFRKKLEESNVSDIKTGEIARHLEFVSHGIRTKLDELKRKEIDRLRQVMKMQHQLERGFKQMGRDLNLPRVEKEKFLAHLDHKNPNSFEVDDLAKLIKQATQDLEDLDKKRREDFKTYEMEKEREHREHLAQLDEEKRKKEEEEYQAMKKKHADHPKVHHPGNREQLEEVWEEADGMDKDSFDPRTFFFMHDTNGDGQLDEVEVEALFQKELDKVYNSENPEDDMVERDEEMNRMREHVFGEVDANKDKMISLEEFLQSTNSDEFDKDEEWKTLDEEEPYEDEEIEQYIREYEERQRKAYEAQGHEVPADPSFAPPPVQDNALHFQGQGQDILQGQGQGQDQGVQHMQQNQPPPVPSDLHRAQPPAVNGQDQNDQEQQIQQQQRLPQQQEHVILQQEPQVAQQQLDQNAQQHFDQQQIPEQQEPQVAQQQSDQNAPQHFDQQQLPRQQEPQVAQHQQLELNAQQQFEQQQLPQQQVPDSPQQEQQVNEIPAEVKQQQQAQQQNINQVPVQGSMPDQPQS